MHLSWDEPAPADLYDHLGPTDPTGDTVTSYLSVPIDEPLPDDEPADPHWRDEDRD